MQNAFISSQDSQESHCIIASAQSLKSHHLYQELGPGADQALRYNLLSIAPMKQLLSIFRLDPLYILSVFILTGIFGPFPASSAYMCWLSSLIFRHESDLCQSCLSKYWILLYLHRFFLPQFLSKEIAGSHLLEDSIHGRLQERYQVSQNLHPSSSVRCYRKIQTKFLASLIMQGLWTSNYIQLYS